MEIEEILEKLPPAPADVVKWINNEVIKNTYIIYNKKKDEAVCTRCGHTFRASRFEIKHNYMGKCPRCKSDATYKSIGIGRGNLTEYFRVLLLTHRGNTVYGTLTEITAEFTQLGKPQLNKWLSAVYVFNENEQTYYKHHPGWCFGSEHWKKVKNVKLSHPPSTMNFYSEPRFARTVLYEKNIKKVFKNSCLKYNWLPDLFFLSDYNSYDYIRYISLSLKYQSIELLAKAGFTRIANDKVVGKYRGACINWRGKTLQKILRLPKRHIRRIRQYNPSFEELAVYQKLSEQDKSLPWKIIQEIERVKNSYNADKIREHIDIVKWCIWANANGVTHYDWIDYIRDCERAGLDIRKKSVLMPDNFHIVHRNLAIQIEEKEDAEKIAKMKTIAETFGMKLESEKLMLKIAESQTELNMESSALGHCVKTYGDRMAAGRTIIYFIRRKDTPDTPYYTLEIRPDGTFIQCRGKNNCGMTIEVEAFKDMVVAEFNKKIKKIKNTAKEAGRSAA